ncbi:unnamed protein product [Chironomus riparius]|uniref:Uncharacterized protein n=1 Tax=Chironomus riparius TaxID=315576 RepID=A0A9N9SBK5_9DIPT|nr:unnamed protein product [Chironomus riparius]
MLKEIFLIFILFLTTLSDGVLINPTSNPSRLQLIFGLGVPLNLENESVTYGWIVKAFYILPDSGSLQKHLNQFNRSNIDPTAGYKWTRFPHGNRQKRDITDKLSGNEKLMENEDSNYKDDESFDDEIDTQGNIPKLSDYPLKTEEELMDRSGTRWLLYDGFARMLTSKGLEGRYCVLRSICEAAESNFGYHNGLFGQLFHIFFTPSSTSDKIVNTEHYDYLKAEMFGQAGEPCDKIFHQCKGSVLEIFTKVYEAYF